MRKYDRYAVGYVCGLLVMALVHIAFDAFEKEQNLLIIPLAFLAIAVILIGNKVRKPNTTTINGVEVDLNGLELESKKVDGDVNMNIRSTESQKAGDIAVVVGAIKSFVNPNESTTKVEFNFQNGEKVVVPAGV